MLYSQTQNKIKMKHLYLIMGELFFFVVLYVTQHMEKLDCGLELQCQVSNTRAYTGMW